MCPPEGFTALQGFDLREYVDGRWFVQAQQAITYLPVTDNFCVTAQYVLTGKNRVSVFNYARRGGVDGAIRFGQLQALVDNLDEPAKLKVGPRFLPGFLYGPYWVLAAGRYSDATGGSGDHGGKYTGNTGNTTDGLHEWVKNIEDEPYQWALISGGPPRFESPTHPGTCRGGDGVNGSGLWIFTRDAQVPKAVVEFVRGLAAAKGFDVSVLNDVVQKGCDYGFVPAAKKGDGYTTEYADSYAAEYGKTAEPAY